jgi:hypothetical protein
VIANSVDGPKVMETLEKNGFKTYFQLYKDGITYDKEGNCYDDDFNKIECEREIPFVNTEIMNSMYLYNKDEDIRIVNSNEVIYTSKELDGNKVFYNIQREEKKTYSFGTYSSGNGEICGVDFDEVLPEGLDACGIEKMSAVLDFKAEGISLIERTGVSNNDLFGYYTWFVDNYMKPKAKEIEDIDYSLPEIENEINKAGLTVEKRDGDVILSKDGSILRFVSDNSKKIKEIIYTNSSYKGYSVEYSVARNYVTGKSPKCVYTYEDKDNADSTCTNEEKKTLTNLASMFGGFWGDKIMISQKEGIKYTESLL